MRLIALGILSLVAVQTPAASPCADAAHHEFDFWIGDWDVFTPDGTLAGRSHIAPFANGCGIAEQWTGAGGGTGRSLNTYDPTDKKWHQYWVGGDGTILQLAGSFANHAMTLESAGNRIRWTPNGDGTVRQVWDVSPDGGKTWQASFDGKYVKVAPPLSAGATYRAPSGLTLKIFVDDSAGEASVSMGEMTFPPNLDSGDHQHGSIEMFYVTAGALEHVVNGRSQTLRPGMVGFVNPPDRVRHKTAAEGATAIVLWVPAQEARRIVARWTKEP